MEIDARTLKDSELTRFRVLFNGVVTPVVYANDEVGIIEVYKGTPCSQVFIAIKATDQRQPGVGESVFDGLITEFKYGFVQIEKLDKDKKNT